MPGCFEGDKYQLEVILNNLGVEYFWDSWEFILKLPTLQKISVCNPQITHNGIMYVQSANIRISVNNILALLIYCDRLMYLFSRHG